MQRKLNYRWLLLPILLIAASAFAVDAPTGISVPDSPGAADLLVKAAEKEQQSQWRPAADLYEQVITAYPRRVAPTTADKDSSTFAYVGLTTVVQDRLSRWPAEGLDVYRQAFGPAAAAQLAVANPHDAAALQEVFDRWFVTEAGKKAGLLLLAARSDAGDFRAAAWVGERLLALHPTLGAQRGITLFATALAEFYDGDKPAAAAKIQELTDRHHGETASIAGHDVVLSDRLAQILNSPPPQPVTLPDAADHWPTFNGPGGRGEVLPSQARPGLAPRPVLLAQPQLPHLSAAQRGPIETQDRDDMNTGQLLGIMPVADRGELFFQDGRTLYALDADSGLPLPGWVRTFGAGQSGRFRLDAFGRARGEQLTVTVTPSRVLAVMGQPDRMAASVGQLSPSDVRLVCLDRSTGKSIWTRSPADLPESSGVARTGEYEGTPLVVGADTVLVVARGSKGAQFEDCYVVALSLRTGDFQWATYIGSANRSIDVEMGAGPHDNAQLALADGRVYALSNLGTVSAIDPVDGRVLWLNAYPRQTVDVAAVFMRNRINGNRAPTKPWAQNPVIVSNGKVFAMPTDGKHLLIYDAGTGREIKRILTEDYDSMDVLLGVRGDWVVTTSEAGCFCINWAAYDHEHADDAIVAKHDNFDDTLPGQPNIVFGRGFVTTTDIFVPTRRRLYRIGFNRSGKVLETYPVRGSWGGDLTGQGAGNVLVTARNVVVAGNARVDVYTDADLARKKYDEEVAAAPTDPAPRVRFAEVLFASGQADAALQKLNEAVNLIGGPQAMRSGTGRALIFSTVLTFAQDAGRNSIAEINSVAGKFFDLAALAADTPSDQASYRLARAAYDHDHHDYAGEVQLCQQVLSDPALRAVTISEDATAAQSARAAIDSAIAQDRSCYAAVEEQARTALHAANDSHDAAKLFDVADVYPNSSAAVEALKGAAAAMDKAGDHAGAVATLSRMYGSTTDGPTRTALLEAIARNQLAMPDGVGPAIDRLSHGVKSPTDPMLSQPLTLPDGSVLANVSFAHAVDALRKLQTLNEIAALPDVKIPARSKGNVKAFNKDESPTASDVTMLLRPVLGFERCDRAVTWSPGTGLSIRDSLLRDKPVNVEFSEPPSGVAWSSHTLVGWSAQTVIAADDAGHVRWSVPLGGLTAVAVSDAGQAFVDEAASSDDVDAAQQQLVERRRRFDRFNFRGGRGFPIAVVNAAAPEPVHGPEHVIAVRPVRSRVVIATSTGRLVGLNADTGDVVWQYRPSDRPADQLLVSPRFTVVRLSDPGGSQLVVIDTVTGHVIGRRKFGPESSPAQLVNAALSEDATLVFTLFNRLMIKDLTEPWKEPPVELVGRPNSDAAPFVGLDQPDQLIVHGGRVLALYDGGKFVRVHDLAGLAESDNPLATGADSNAVSLRLAGPRLFVSHAKTFRQYNLIDHTDHYAPEPYSVDWAPKIRELLLSRGEVVLVDAPADHGNSPLPFVRLLMYGRYPANNHTTRESGKLDFDPLVQEPSGIVNWQAVDGGVLYLGGNQVLHLLSGAGG